MNITAADYRAMAEPDSANRRVRGTRQTVIDGIRFDSRREARAWTALLLRQKAGEISGLRRQVKIPLQGRDGPILTPTGRVMLYVADFVFTEAGREITADAKGHPLEPYQTKRAILAAQGIMIREL
jgi:hypothetical protein